MKTIESYHKLITTYPIVYLSFCFIRAIVFICILDYFLSDFMFGCAIALFMALIIILVTITWIQAGVIEDELITFYKLNKWRKLK